MVEHRRKPPDRPRGLDAARIAPSFSLPEEELAWKLLEEYEIPTTPGVYFDAPGHLRIPFGGITDAQIADLVQRAADLVADGRVLGFQIEERNVHRMNRRGRRGSQRLLFGAVDFTDDTIFEVPLVEVDQ